MNARFTAPVLAKISYTVGGINQAGQTVFYFGCLFFAFLMVMKRS